jgi:pepF/M3 family oligoendopeptidase
MKWDLSALYKGFDDHQIESDFASLCDAIRDVKQLFAGKGDAGEKLSCFVSLSQTVGEKMELLASYANLSLAADVNNQPAAALRDRVLNLAVDLEIAFSACQRFLGSMANEELEHVVLRDKKLLNVRFALENLKDKANHLLAADTEELVLKMSLTGAEAFSQLRDRLDGMLMVDYRDEALPLSAIRAKAHDTDAQVRKEAYLAELAAYPRIEIPMSAALNSIKGEALTLCAAKHYPSVLEQTLADSNMDAETLGAMLEAIRASLPSFRKYLRRKGEILGHANGLPYYDLFAPLITGDCKPTRYTVEQAKVLLVSQMGKFSPELGEFIRQAFDGNWIDMFPRAGKGGGAFCNGLHSLNTSRILTNFTGSLSDISTLAHELGHAWHNRCMAGLPYLLIATPMPLAETASIFNETFFAHAFRSKATGAEALMMLEADLMEATQVIVDIYSRFLFESAVIEQRKTHALGVHELKEMMLDAQRQSYGDGLDQAFLHPYMWACKPHYYSPRLNFYNFPYAFGLLFGRGVFAQFLQRGNEFVPEYNNLLRICGSYSVADVAAKAGIDVRTVGFWEKSLLTYAGEIDTFITLTDGK